MGQLTHDEVQSCHPRFITYRKRATNLLGSQFFAKLADIFTSRKSKAHGAVFLTQKRRKISIPVPSYHGL